MFQFNGDSILYNEALIPLSAHALYLDGSLDADTSRPSPMPTTISATCFRLYGRITGTVSPYRFLSLRGFTGSMILMQPTPCKKQLVIHFPMASLPHVTSSI